jgi:hypothetical protein
MLYLADQAGTDDANPDTLRFYHPFPLRMRRSSLRKPR